jgi:predicted Ser/Thr protein kinase
VESKEDKLKKEAERATELLKGKTVAQVWRHHESEIGMEFTDGTRLFVDKSSKGVEVTITGTAESRAAEES